MVKPKYIVAYELYRSGKPVGEIAEALGVTAKTVYSYIARARKALGEARPGSGLADRVAVLENTVRRQEEMIRELYAKIDELARAIDHLSGELRKITGPITVPELKGISEAVEGYIAGYDELFTMAKKYFEIAELLGITRHGEFDFEAWVYSKAYTGKYVSLGRFYGFAKISPKSGGESSYVFVSLQYNRILRREEVIERLGKIRKGLIEVLERLPKKINERLYALTPSEARRLEELYNELRGMVRRQ